MQFTVRLFLCALVAMAPVPSVWTVTGFGDASALEDAASAAVAAVVAQADGHVIGSPAESDDHENDGEEEAALDGHEHRPQTEAAHGTAFHSSDQQTSPYPTYRPPRRPLV